MRRGFLVMAAVVMAALVSVPAAGLAGSEAEQQVFVVVAVGDIAQEQLPRYNLGRNQYDDVADLIYGLGADRFLMLGDGQHNDGTYDNYMTYYDPYFSKVRDITCPVVGNHDYYTSDSAEGYFAYFGELAHGPHGYYSFDLGSWHVIALNSQIPRLYDHTEPGNPAYDQHQWLKSDLESHPEEDYTGIIAYMHHPMYDWELYDNADWYYSYEIEPQAHLWQALYDGGVDMVLSGHNHNYQRWLPQDALGNYDPGGVAQFVAGTGGSYLWSFPNSESPANLVSSLESDFGVLRLTLYEDRYDFEFVATDGEILDSGYGIVCVK
ncbi:MAG: Metallophos protein [Candidatus Thermoplasmatota archaeon]|nr:Metallophos protein [Candidatus Thermoplasmatota archaeon]